MENIKPKEEEKEETMDCLYCDKKYNPNIKDFSDGEYNNEVFCSFKCQELDLITK